MTTVQPPDLSALLRSETAKSMMPGFARDDLADGAPDDAESELNLELRLISLVAALRRVKVWIGAGDRQFVADMRGRRFADMTELQRERLVALSWIYRAHLPAGLRAKAEPEARKIT